MNARGRPQRAQRLYFRVENFAGAADFRTIDFFAISAPSVRERHAEHGEELLGLLVALCRRYDCDLETSKSVDLVELHLREGELLLHA